MTSPRRRFLRLATLVVFSTNVPSALAAAESLPLAPLRCSGAGPPMITMPLRLNSQMGYDVVMIANGSDVVSLLLDYLQRNVWAANANALLQCSIASDFFKSTGSLSSTFTSVTYRGTIYNPNQCYLGGAVTTRTTFTRVSGSATVTFTEAAPLQTTESYNLTYPSGNYAGGYFVNTSFTVQKTTANGTSVLRFDNLRYLLAGDTNMHQGGFGLAGPAPGGGVFDSLKSRGLIQGSGYSVYFFANDTADKPGGHLLVGAVNQSLYTGDFYVFPRIKHVGWGDPNAVLPILQMDSVSLTNLETSQLARLYDTEPVAMVMDASLLFSYLPREMIIQIALQTNAMYSSMYDAWALDCTSGYNIRAALNFKFGPLTVNIPLSALLESTSLVNWTFSDGSPACVLNVVPSDTLGYAAFGSTFVRYIYMAMDNEGGSIAVANANIDSNAQMGCKIDSPCRNSAAHILSGTIPFATTALYAGAVTLTFASPRAGRQLSILECLTDTDRSSGHIFVSGSRLRTLRQAVSPSASAAATRPRSAGAGSLNDRLYATNGPVCYVLLLLGGVVGLVLM